jgi:uncharacterized phage infection (PIP) family protein YhgE
MRIPLAALSAVLFLSFLPTTQEKMVPIRSRADMAQTMDQAQSDLAALNQHHESYRQAAEKLSALYSNLSKKVEEVGKAANAVKSGGASSSFVNQLMQATQQMQEMQMSFNLQYLQLQQQMQQENRQYTEISNIMKSRHDTVKSAIGNIK